MRVSATLAYGALLLTSLIPSVTAYGTLGFSLGTKRNSDSACKNAKEYEADLDKIKPYSQVIRLYSTRECKSMEIMYPVIVKKGFKAIVGVWAVDKTHFEEDVEVLAREIKKHGDKNIIGVNVGTESLYREEVTGEQLAAQVEYTRKALKAVGSNVPIGIADSWNKLVEGDATPAIQASDIIFAHAFSYWQGSTMNNATWVFWDDIQQALKRVEDIKGHGNFQFWVGETGWPVGGANFQAAVPGKENAAIHWKESICPMLKWGINVSVFEAFDEKWKPTEKDNDVENHWGVLEDNGTPRYDLEC